MSLKNDILELLEQNRGTVYPGTVLAERFGVSRNAVWKAVNSLKADGHEILSDGRKGYLLSEMSDRLSAEGITSFLPDSIKDIPLKVYDEIDSTNTEAKRYILSGAGCPAVIVSEKQTAGRTRRGSRFYSPYGTGLYISVIIPVDCAIDATKQIPVGAADAVSRAVSRVTGIDTKAVPPADLYIGDKKVCGILIEGDTDLTSGVVSHIIVGIGINVTTDDFPEDIRENAASLGAAAVRCRLAAAVIGEICSEKLYLGRKMS